MTRNRLKNVAPLNRFWKELDPRDIYIKHFYPLFEEKVGVVSLSGSEVGLESELSRRFEVP